MRQRRFNKYQRIILAFRSAGRCSNCGARLAGNFHADHVIPHSKKGETTLQNGQALCVQCNLKKGSKMTKQSTTIKLRAWQAEAIKKAISWWDAGTDRHFVVNAAPGAGKTLMASALSLELLDKNKIERIVVIAPRDEVVRQWAKALKAITGRHVAKITAADELTVDEARDDIAITWHSVKNLTALMADICTHARTLVIADEIHHAALQNVWGQDATNAFADAAYILALTGTPVRAEGDVIWISDHIQQRTDGSYTLSYGDAIRAGYCVPAAFQRHTCAFAYDIMGRKVSIDRNNAGDTGDTVIDEIIKKAASYERLMYDCVIGSDGKPLIPSHHSTMIDWAIKKLDQLRNNKPPFGKPDAGAMFVAPDIPTAEHIAELIEAMTGDKPAIVHSRTAKPAKVIKDFRKSDSKWIISVDMLSEGVDIPRLRVLVCLSRAKTELRFRQLIGRVIRKDDEHDMSRAYVIIPDFAVFDEFATRIEEEMPAQMEPGNVNGTSDEDAVADDTGEDDVKRPRQADPWVCVNGHHNDGGRTCVTCGADRYTVHMTWEQSSGWRDKASAIITRGMTIDEETVVLGEDASAAVQEAARTDAQLRRILSILPEEAIAVVGKVFIDISKQRG